MAGLVSVIIRTIQGREEQLEKAICSIKNQTHKEIEIIIVKEGKSCEALNIGLRKANGDYIAFCDDDDEWLPTKLEKQLPLLTENTSFVICWIEDRRFGETYIIKNEPRIYFKSVLKKFNLASTSAYLFNTNFLKNIGGFDESFPSAQEYELAIRSSSIFPVNCVQEVLVIQNKSKGQISTNWKKKRDGLKLLLNKHKQFYMGYGIPSYIGFRLRFIGLQALYLSAELFGDRIYKIIIPMKRRM